MKIGIISDTHNDFKMTRKACNVFNAYEVDFVIHAGDLTSPDIIELFKDFKCRFVLGNADSNIDILNRECDNLGIHCVEETCELNLGEKNILVMHGNIVSIFREAVASGKYDYIIKGHTHYFENYIRNNTRIINPGTVVGSGEHTVAILDTDTDEVEKVSIDT
jgi:uncharacterized protein